MKWPSVSFGTRTGSSSATTTMVALLSSLSLLAAPAAAMLRCEHIQVDGQKFNFKDLGGPHSVVTWQDHLPPYDFVNTTYTIDLCAPLKKDGPASESCPNGARVCGIKRGIKADSDQVIDVVSIAGELQDHGGGALDPKVTRLKTSDSTADAQKEGVRIVMYGGRHPQQSSGREQRAIVEMLCDKDRTGKEGEWSPKDDKYEQVPVEDSEGLDDDDKEEEAAAAAAAAAAGSLRTRAEGEGESEGDGSDGKSEHQLLKENAALLFDSYGPMADNGNVDVLRLTWHTKYACEGLPADEYPQSEHWGFFTWLVILVFLATATYLIFGSWLNYNRYGARGWDLLPHGDTIRDIPYLLKDWVRRVMNTIQGSGSRGGYSTI